ncbi:hypothetical protein PIB30_007734 [Stylosanthes scabra]|uniref:Disease resistance protein At4g27190-like leucine-rich repeats domain-containing protein n=1 Tax=Stylosanthes scabra TaxID=79078 RepID=A0ABU6Y6B1_9FABA|nr:hypothetical protein [Stylosanthes scabra]
MVGIFQHLSSLKVTNCKSIKAMFYVDADEKNKLAGNTVNNLQDVHLETLPKLEHLFYWASEEKKDQPEPSKKKKDQPEENFSLKNLQKIWVQDCDRLENIFSVHVVKTTTENLESLVVSDCSQLREIVAEEEDANKPVDKIVFTKLATIKLLRLPKFKSFCGRDSELKLPALSDLSIEGCNMLKPYFKTENTDAQRKPIYFFEEALNELKSLEIGSWHAKVVNNPNLVSLWLNDSSLEELVPLERLPSIGRLGVVPKLKSLNLTNLGKLKEIGFERDAILRMIESLTLKSCPRLMTLAPSSVSLSHLTNLEVVGCKGLTYLISPSTARALGQLNTMKVINCDSLMEIVSDAAKEKEDVNKVVIVFQQLTTLELVTLEKLQTFCSFKNCSFEFPRLEKFVVNVCPKLKNFSQGVSNMPMLQKVYLAHEKEKMTWHWKGNLQDTLQYIFKEKKFFECMDTLRDDTDHFEYLNQFWQMNKGLQEDLFKNLKSLTVCSCSFKSYAIPSNVLLSLKILEELVVASCGNITSIFEMDNLKKEQASFQLKKLTLHSLDVKHVWQHSKQVIHVFENLQQVTIISCDKLESVFPVELAKKLTKLESLCVAFCKSLVEIVGKEKGVIGKDEGAIERTEHFVFPELNELQVDECNKLELFQSHQQQHLEDQSRTSNMKRRQPLFANKVAIPKVKKLYLDPNQTLPLSSWLGQSENELLPCLIELQFYNSSYLRSLLKTKITRMKALAFGKNTAFGENSDDSFLLKIMKKCPKLEIFKIYCNKNYWKSVDIPKGLGNRMLYLKEMSLSSLHELESISGLEYLLYLKLLCVSQCPKLTTLGQNCSNLKKLQINSCGGLKCLFTSSAAKQLKNLEELRVSHCDSLKEIVGKEQQSDETESASTPTNDIELKRLLRIELFSLESLECFYSGNAILKLPSLIWVNIETCPEMKKFSPERERREEPSRPVQVSYYSSNDDFFFHDELDVAVAFSFLQQPKESLVLSDDDHPVLKVVWPAKMHMPKGYISGSNLKCLVVKGCKSLTDAILPSHLFPFLNNLEKLEVRECNSVKAIFDVEDTSNMIVIPLKTIILENLPALTHVVSRSLDKEGVTMIVEQELRCLTLQGFKDIDESDAFPFDDFFSMVSLPNIEMLMVADCAFRGIFPSKLPDTSNYAKILSGLKKLELRNLHKLESTGLEILHTRVASSTLTWLKVECCASLKYLFTSSTVKCLVQLQHLYISNCEALETVLVADQPHGEDEIITLECLKELSLSILPKLESFYNGMSTLNFTGSAQVSISECKSMKTFSHGDVKVLDSWSLKIDGVSFSEDNSNAIVSQQFLKGSNTTDELASQS